MASSSASAKKKMSQSEAEDSLFQPGDLVVFCGVYQVRHRLHRFPHEVTMLAGETFPRCRYCALKVRFRLIRSAQRVELDYDFEHHPAPRLVVRG